MAEAYTYTEATNTVVNTGGTSGTPSTFAGFVTADRAGTATLLAATAGLSPTLALTYQIRPVDVIALLITFTVAAKTAEADYIFITGTDWRDAAQTEAIDVTAGNGAYTSTKYFRTITNIDCSDNAAGGGTQWNDGTVAVTQPQWGVIWDYGNGQYQVDCTVVFGNGSTSTYFTSTDFELVFWNDFKGFRITSAATLQIGELYGSWGVNGAAWVLNKTNTYEPMTIVDTTANLKVYSSALFSNNTVNMYVKHGTTDFRNVLNLGHSFADLGWEFFNTTVSIQKSYFAGQRNLTFRATPGTISDVHVHKLQYGFKTLGDDATLSGCDITSVQTIDVYVYGLTDNTSILMRDPVNHITKPVIQIKEAAFAKEQYTCNITVVDKDGTLLDGVEVLCEDEADATVWTTTTGDTDTGKIDEQIIDYKKWTGTSETLTEYSPHKFTLSKAGYETLILENVTVDAPIAWHLELKGPVRYKLGSDTFFEDDS